TSHRRSLTHAHFNGIFEGGCDYHPSTQQVAWVDTETGECGERRLTHQGGEAEKFYRELKKKETSVRVGMEATGHSRWFERLLGELNYEVWVGDPATISAKRVRKQRNDRRDAQHILKLMLEDNFPNRLSIPASQLADWLDAHSLLLQLSHFRHI